MPEEYRNLVNLILRDHEGYTGDGKGGVGALPVGDRSTARKPVEKRDLREVMLAADASVDAAVEAAAQAVTAADAATIAMVDAQGATLQAASRDALLANTATSYPVGTIFATRAEGYAYEVVSSGGDMTTAGGVNLKSLTYDVRAFGATPSDGSSDFAAFQAAIDRLPNVAGPHTIDIPAGTYHGDLAALAMGNRNIVWRQTGAVSFLDGQPPGWLMNANWKSDNRRPWFIGGFGFARDKETGGASLPVIDVRRNTDHTGGSYGFVHPALRVITNVLSDTGAFENAASLVLEDKFPQTNAVNYCAYQAEARRKSEATGSKGQVFGGNVLARDETLLDSIASGAGIVGLEVNVAARGLDDGNRRVLLDLLPKCHGQTGTMEAYAAMRVKGTTSGGTTTLKRAISIESGAGGGAVRGVHIEASSEAIYVRGAPAYVMDTATENVATVRLRRAGTTPPGEILGTLAFSGENSAGEVKSFATITATLGSGAVGVERGGAVLSVMSGGGTVPVLTMSGGLPDNPLSVRVGGSLKQVTQGAADSGGTGFRMLRVPN